MTMDIQAITAAAEAEAEARRRQGQQSGAQQFAGNLRAAAERAAPAMEDVNRSAASGLMEGVEGLAGILSLPARATDAIVDRGLGFLGVGEDNYIRRGARGLRENGDPASALMRSGGVVQDVLDYEPQTRAGQYVETGARYAPGAVMLGGGYGAASTPTQAFRTAGENVLRYAAVPGMAEETAGQAVRAVAGEGSTAEAIARPVAALGAGILASRPTGQVRPLGARENDIRHAETLRTAGVEPTAGQVTRSGALRALEGTRGQVDEQLQQVTRAALRSIGANADEVTPQVLARSYDDIVGMMDDAVSGATFTPGNRFASDAEGVRQFYINSTGAGDVVPGVGNIIDEFVAASRTGRPVSLSQMRTWRSTLGELMNSGKSSAIQAAGRLRGLIDDATTETLRSMGRDSDVEALARSREMFRNWLSVADASTRPGASGGLLSPEALRQAVIRTEGRRNVATGRNQTELGRLTEATDAILRPMPTVREAGIRQPPEWATAGGLGALAGYNIAGAPGAAAGFAAGSQLPRVSEAIIRSNALQNLMMDPRGQFANALLGASSGLASQP
jgi:hypothetical protein